ncbi:MAG: enoyl-CoA hydratase/isomerase family protein [Bacteroidetes bacterium]|nr:enoyl-CoA hydratase/isomerase family protein [Bacteroidota bacterium]
MSNRVSFEIRGKVAYLKLNRPEKRNAIDDVAIEEMGRHFDRANSDENVRAIVFEGEGSVFSAGADLDYLMKLSKNSSSANFEDSCALKDFLLEVYRSRKLVCAIVRGPALAGAFGLVLACDIVFASEKAKFGFTEVKIGFVPAVVVNLALRKMREVDVRRLVLTGKIMGGEEALRLGLISEVIEDSDIQQRVGEFLREFVTGTSKRAVSLTKEILSEVRDMTLEEAMKYGAMMNVVARSTDDFQKGVNSFLNKSQVEWE